MAIKCKDKKKCDCSSKKKSHFKKSRFSFPSKKRRTKQFRFFRRKQSHSRDFPNRKKSIYFIYKKKGHFAKDWLPFQASEGGKTYPIPIIHYRIFSNHKPSWTLVFWTKRAKWWYNFCFTSRIQWFRQFWIWPNLHSPTFLHSNPWPYYTHTFCQNPNCPFQIS